MTGDEVLRICAALPGPVEEFPFGDRVSVDDRALLRACDRWSAASAKGEAFRPRLTEGGRRAGRAGPRGVACPSSPRPGVYGRPNGRPVRMVAPHGSSWVEAPTERGEEGPLPPAEPSVVFVVDAVNVTRPRSQVEDRLLVGGLDLRPMASEATADGEDLVVGDGPVSEGHLLGAPVGVHLGRLQTRDGAAAIPIRWDAPAFQPRLPMLDGTILVSTMGQHRCRLAIEAAYRIPMGGPDHLLDRTVLHRVAGGTVRSFLKRLASTLAEGS
jgi:hypothetical protein